MAENRQILGAIFGWGILSCIGCGFCTGHEICCVGKCGKEEWVFGEFWEMNGKEIAKIAEEKYKTVRGMKGTVVITTNFLGKKKVGVALLKISVNLDQFGNYCLNLYRSSIALRIIFNRAKYVVTKN